MANGRAALDAQVNRLRTLGKAIVRDAAPKVAVAVKKEIDASISAGREPSGKPWTPTASGKKPLANAAAAVSVTAVGTVVVVRLEGHEVHHHRGDTRGNVVRQIIPSGKTPEPVTKAIADVVETEFREHMGVRGGR